MQLTLNYCCYSGTIRLEDIGAEPNAMVISAHGAKFRRLGMSGGEILQACQKFFIIG